MKIRQQSKPLTAAMILLIMVIITLIAVIGQTWDFCSANHTLTYTGKELSWDSKTNVNDDGSAELTVFQKSYQNVESQKDDKLIAPGTSGNDSIVLRNTVNRSITYTAIAYYIRNDARIPVEMTFSGTALSETEKYTLPAGIDKSSILRAMSGTVAANSEQDFNFQWNWEFETADLSSDLQDTALGNDAAEGKDEGVTVGLYIVIGDRGAAGTDSYTITPVKKADDSDLWLYISLALASLLALILLLLPERIRKDSSL